MVPAWLAERFDGLENDPQTHALVASAVAAEQVMDLVERGVGDFHFYTMNRADLVVRHLPHDRHPRRTSAPKVPRLGRGLRLAERPRNAKRPGKNPAFSNWLTSWLLGLPTLLAVQGRTPMMRAPMKANAAQIINALIGLVSPMT